MLNEPNPSLPVRIANLLSEGHSQTRVAKLVGITERGVAKHAKKLADKGLLLRIGINPAIYTKPKLNEPNPISGGAIRTEPVLLPHKFGATFYVRGKIRIGLDKYGKHIYTEPTHTTMVYQKKVVLWLKAFRGLTVAELNNNGEADLIALSKSYAAQLGIELELDRFFKDREWVLIDKQVSKRIAQAIGIEQGGQKEIANAMLKYNDSTHRDRLEINVAPFQLPTIPTTDAELIDVFFRNREAVSYLILSGMPILKQISEGVIAVNIKAEAINERVKKLEHKE